MVVIRHYTGSGRLGFESRQLHSEQPRIGMTEVIDTDQRFLKRLQEEAEQRGFVTNLQHGRLIIRTCEDIEDE